MKPPSRRLSSPGFTLLEVLASVSIFAMLLVGLVYALQRLAANQRQAELDRVFRREAEAAFNQISADLEGMPLRNDLDYRFGEPTQYPGGMEVSCVFVTDQTGTQDLLNRASPDYGRPEAPLRAFSLAAYRVGPMAQEGGGTQWGGLQRGLSAFALDDQFQGLQPPAGFQFPVAAPGTDALARQPALPPNARVQDWAPASLLAWPLESRHFTSVSPQVMALGIAYQLQGDEIGPDGKTCHAGQFVAWPPRRERPTGSGEFYFAMDRVGALIVGVAILPEGVQARLTLAELDNLRLALDYSATLAQAGETHVAYWERRAGPLATDPLPTIPENLRRELRFQQRIMRIGTGH